MIILDLHHLFKTDSGYSKVPKVVFDWVTEKEKQFSDIEFQISFSGYPSEEEKKNYSSYERIYGPSLPQLRWVTFPLKDGFWSVKLIGNQSRAIEASGLMKILESGDPRIQVISAGEGGDSLRAYNRINPITNSEEELIDIEHGRNINDEWEFRGSAKEFLDEYIDKK